MLISSNAHDCIMHLSIVVQAINLTLYVRFSSIIGNIVLNGNANEFLLTVQNVVSS